MKLIYSHLQKFLPDLKVEPQKLRDDLSMIGHFCNFYEEIEGETVFDLDIKNNRGDCLGYYSLARDLSVLYNIPLVLPKIDTIETAEKPTLPISVTSPDVTRIMAVKISNVTVEQSPEWLAKFVKLHHINSINNIVDLTNYVMFMYGIPNHAFDAKISSDNLIWENNNGKSPQFTTLDGTILNLSPENLVISNPDQVLSTDLVGGQNSGINDSTADIIIEVAIYNRVRIRHDSKQLKTITEASIRLEKDLDIDTIPLAFDNLAYLITQLCGGQISSQVYDYYPTPNKPPQIEFDSQLPTTISGIEIPTDFSLKILDSLKCISSPLVKEGTEGRLALVTPPSIRKDITLPEDLAEEVIRFYGYEKISTDVPLTLKEVPDITPKVLYLIEQLKDKLTDLGYDEIRSWSLVQKPLDPGTAITTQNSINSEYPYLRQSIIQSLEVQLDQYQRFKLPNPQFFEIGKIFSQIDGKYVEHYALGIYHYDFKKLKSDINKLNLSAEIKNNNYSEIILDDLPAPDSYVPKVITNRAYELTSQIITLDANVTIADNLDDAGKLNLIKTYSDKIDPKILWQMEISDVFLDPKINQYRYTFRVSYFNCDDKTAKSVHLFAFDLDRV